MSTLRELPHINDLELMSREALVSEAERIALELASMDAELHNSMLDASAGLFVEPEWQNRVRYGRQMRRRLLAQIKTRVHTLRRIELGGDPQAVMHRRFLHAMLTAVNRMPEREIAAELYQTARAIAAEEGKSCDLCAMQKLDDAQRAQRVAEHINAQTTEPPVVSDLADGDQMPPALTG